MISKETILQAKENQTSLAGEKGLIKVLDLKKDHWVGVYVKEGTRFKANYDGKVIKEYVGCKKAIKATWDYKNGEEAHKEIIRALNEIGICVYPSPNCEGSDSFGIVISTEPLTSKEIEEIDIKG